MKNKKNIVNEKIELSSEIYELELNEKITIFSPQSIQF